MAFLSCNVHTHANKGANLMLMCVCMCVFVKQYLIVIVHLTIIIY